MVVAHFFIVQVNIMQIVSQSDQGGETKNLAPHIVMRGLIIILAGLATSYSARKQIELELQ